MMLTTEAMSHAAMLRRQYDAGSKEARQHAVPVRARCETVEVSFTQLETDHLPARATREQEISAHKAQAKVPFAEHICL